MSVKTKLIRVPEDFDELLNKQIDQLISDLETLGIPKRKMSKTKATQLLTKRLYENKIKLGLL